jgi:hypothetical protein
MDKENPATRLRRASAMMAGLNTNEETPSSVFAFGKAESDGAKYRPAGFFQDCFRILLWNPR